MVTMLILILLPAAFLLPPGAGAGEIIGGREARPHSRPYMAYLQIQDGNETFNCGGFLVSEDFVLTAGHCKGDDITVKLGVHKISGKAPQEIHVRKQILHPHYDDRTTNNDIMLLKLEKRATLNSQVKTIPLPQANGNLAPGTVCSVAGWGRTGCTSFPDALQEVELDVMSDDSCLKNPYDPYPNYDKATMLCVGDPKKRKDSWKGDSGGPLVCRGIAEGIVSWGPCCPPGVYTKVSTFVPWIQATMKKPPL